MKPVHRVRPAAVPAPTPAPLAWRVFWMGALTALVLLVLQGCAAVMPDSAKPIVQVAGIEPVKGQGLEWRLNVKLRVQNPAPIDIPYQGVSVRLKTQGRDLASGVSNESGVIPKYSEKLITLPVSISAFNAARQAWAWVQGDLQKGIDYELEGQLAGPAFLSVPFNTAGHIDLP